ncbi:MAG: hypothetical protein KDD47_02680, partial [Acidobacteria bacterium]|nr:hypothetical protein [Acidobacteriota bacterium]
MTFTLNGFGTSYWGKARRTVRRGRCEQCGNVADLSSYDTTKYAVALFLPIVPLSKVRVFDDCPRCRRHRLIKLKEWNRLKEESVGKALADFRASPESAEAAAEALRAAVGYDDETAFLEVSREVLRHHGGKAELVTMMAGGLEEFGHAEQAEAALRRGLKLSDEPEMRWQLARLLMISGKPAEARPLLRPAYAEGNSSIQGLAYLLVESFQAAGQHEEALGELDAIAAAFPEEAEDGDHQRYRKLSQKHRGSGRAIVSANLKPVPKIGEEEDWGGRFARVFAPLVLVVALGSLAVFAFRGGTSREVYFVNGLEEAYEIHVDGRRLALPPGKAVPRILPLRTDLTVESVRKQGPAPPPFPLRLEQGVFDHLRKTGVVVVNPDRSAILMRQEVEYAVKPRDDAPNPVAFWVGEATYELPATDFAFRDLPDEVDLPSSRSRVMKSHLSVLEVPPQIGYAILEQEGREEAVQAYLEARARLDGGGDEILPFLAERALPWERFEELSQTHRTARPLRVTWHRAYQEGRQRLGQVAETEEEYRRLWQASPEDPDLQYLRARAVADPVEASRRMAEAAGKPGASFWAIFARAYQQAAEGRSAESCETVQRALELRPEDLNLHWFQEQCLVASGDFEAVLERLAAEREGGFDFNRFRDEVRWTAAAGGAEPAQALVAENEKVLESAAAEKEQAYLASLLEAEIHLGLGDLAAYETAIAGLEGEGEKLRRALLSGAATEALAVIEGMANPSAGDYLLLALSSRRTEPEVA